MGLDDFVARLTDPHGATVASMYRRGRRALPGLLIDADRRQSAIASARTLKVKLTGLDRYTAHVHDGSCAGPGADPCPGESCVEVHSRIPAAHVTTAIAETLLIWDDAYRDGTAPAGALDLVDAGNPDSPAYSKAAHVRIVSGLSDTAREILENGAYGSDPAPSRPEVELLAILLTDVLGGDRSGTPSTDRAAAEGLAHADLLATARSLSTGVGVGAATDESAAVRAQVEAAQSSTVKLASDSPEEGARQVKVAPGRQEIIIVCHQVD